MTYLLEIYIPFTVSHTSGVLLELAMIWLLLESTPTLKHYNKLYPEVQNQNQTTGPEQIFTRQRDLHVISSSIAAET